MLPTDLLKPTNLYIMLAVMVSSLAIGFGAGWQANGWRLGKQLVAEQGKVAVLSQSIHAQNKAVERLQAQAKEASERRAAADKRVDKLRKVTDARVRHLKERKPIINTCEAEMQELAAMLEWAR